MRHFALIPAKRVSRRCPNKNWRPFLGKRSLVDFALSLLPKGFFHRVVVSTDKRDYRAPRGAEVHRRGAALARRRSSVTELVALLLDRYNLEDSDYLWLLNPTAPFRSRGDFAAIRRILERERPPAVVSAVGIIPYLWKNGEPAFKTGGRRVNTDDFKDEYAVENGMFYAVRAGHFRRAGTWYGRGVRLYRQRSAWAAVDIDDVEDFEQARALAGAWLRRGR